MKRLSFLFCISFLAVKAIAQSGYTDSIIQYQLHYKEELFPIIKNDTAHVKFYPIDPVYKVTAIVEKLSGQKFFSMATSDGKAHQAIKYAVLKFIFQGKEYQLFAYQLSFLLSNPEKKNYVFIPFTDGASGIDNYMGGRYIDFVTSDISKDNKLVIDFNKAYNPYCAFKTGYSCPIPPKENNLTVEIWGGEMDFMK